MKNIKFKTLLKNLEQSRNAIAWQRVLEHPRLAKSLLRKAILIILDRVTKESCILLHLFLVDVYRLGRKSGWLYCALYLKQCMISLKIAYGGVKLTHSMSVPVSLTRSGYPRIIPRFARIIMYKRDERADRCVKLFLTFMSFYTIVIKAKKIRMSLFSSIRNGIKDITIINSWVGKLELSLKELMLRYVPDIRTIPLNQGMVWRPSWKSIPTYQALPALWELFPQMPRRKSPYVMEIREIAAYSSLCNYIHTEEKRVSSGMLFPKRVRYAFDHFNDLFSSIDILFFEQKIRTTMPSWPSWMGPPMTGRLACKIDGGGKRRVFAIGNSINQRLLTPVHTFLADVLKKIPMDGTFNQLAPLIRLKGSKSNYCYDLTAATDRWPLVFLYSIMVVLFGHLFASATVNSALCCNVFFIQFLNKADPNNVNHWVGFNTGQPLGYRSSWPLFSLSHHILVWWSAEQVYPGVRFDRYALLGDDIVISDDAVAAVYRDTLKLLQVDISMSKSLVSQSGAAEFAKRFYIHNIGKELSSVTLKALLGVHLPINRLGLAYRYPIKRFSTFRRLGGAGYKACSRVPGKDNSFVSAKEKEEYCLWVQLCYPSLNWYFGKGQPLAPTDFWFVFRELLEAYRPRDLQRPPAEVFTSESQPTYLEYTSLRCQTGDWLQYFSWWLGYYRMAYCLLDYSIHQDKTTLDRVTLDEVFDAPYFCGGWCISDKDHLTIRYTLIHRILNKLEKRSVVPLFEKNLDLEPNLFTNPYNQWCKCWKSGTIQGSGENTFLVNREGLINPPELRCKTCGTKSLVSF